MSDPDKWGQTVLAGGAGAVAAALACLAAWQPDQGQLPSNPTLRTVFYKAIKCNWCS